MASNHKKFITDSKSSKNDKSSEKSQLLIQAVKNFDAKALSPLLWSADLDLNRHYICTVNQIKLSGTILDIALKLIKRNDKNIFKTKFKEIIDPIFMLLTFKVKIKLEFDFLLEFFLAAVLQMNKDLQKNSNESAKTKKRLYQQELFKCMLLLLHYLIEEQQYEAFFKSKHGSMLYHILDLQLLTDKLKKSLDKGDIKYFPFIQLLNQYHQYAKLDQSRTISSSSSSKQYHKLKCFYFDYAHKKNQTQISPMLYFLLNRANIKTKFTEKSRDTLLGFNHLLKAAPVVAWLYQGKKYDDKFHGNLKNLLKQLSMYQPLLFLLVMIYRKPLGLPKYSKSDHMVDHFHVYPSSAADRKNLKDTFDSLLTLCEASQQEFILQQFFVKDKLFPLAHNPLKYLLNIKHKDNLAKFNDNHKQLSQVYSQKLMQLNQASIKISNVNLIDKTLFKHKSSGRAGYKNNKQVVSAISTSLSELNLN